MKACPYCAEQIQDAAVVCRFCGRELGKEHPAARGPTAVQREAEEQALWVGRPAVLAHAGKVAGGIVLIAAAVVFAAVVQERLWVAAALALLGVLLIAAAWIRTLRYRYEITTLRALAREGLLSQTTSEIQLDDIRNIVVERTLPERLLGLGTVELSTAGESGMEVTFRSIRDPQGLVRLINEHNA